MKAKKQKRFGRGRRPPLALAVTVKKKKKVPAGGCSFYYEIYVKKCQEKFERSHSATPGIFGGGETIRISAGRGGGGVDFLDFFVKIAALS